MIQLNNFNKIGVYIHIPFCRRKCGYCDFYSLPCQTNHSRFEDFTHSLIQEIRLRSKIFSFPQKLRTIFVGGGTPSLLPCDQIKRIVHALSNFFDLTNLIEFTIEVNPGTVTHENLKFFQEIGINRISIGVQTFQKHLLKKLERIHTSKQGIAAFELARKVGFKNINFDLIFGIPEQTKKDWQDTLNQAVSLNPEHLSVYNLTYEEGTPFYSRLKAGSLETIGEESEYEFYNFAVNLLQKANYQRYEISNYCKSGFQCAHNLGYWNYYPYLGFGPSAHSFDGKVRRWNNRNLENYISNLTCGELPSFEQETIDLRTQVEEWIFLQMRQVKGLDLSVLQDQFKLPELNWREEIIKIFGKKWQQFFKLENHTLSFTTRGFWLSDEILPKLMSIVS